MCDMVVTREVCHDCRMSKRFEPVSCGAGLRLLNIREVDYDQFPRHVKLKVLGI